MLLGAESEEQPKECLRLKMWRVFFDTLYNVMTREKVVTFPADASSCLQSSIKHITPSVFLYRAYVSVCVCFRVPIGAAWNLNLKCGSIYVFR
jgi:hypothetical protein